MDIILFLLARLLTRSFWYLVGASLLGALALAMRGYYRNEIFNAAKATLGKWQ